MLLRFLLYILLRVCIVSATLHPIQYTISRRGGSFPAPEIANLTFLLSELQTAESRLNATVRTHNEGNGFVRKPRKLYGTQSDTILLGNAGREGNWFATLEIGEPPQTVDMDLDMLTTDWWILSTRSGTGSFFLDFNSKTYQDSENAISFPTCREPRDVVHFPTVDRSVPVDFAHCRPIKQWIRSLIPSGAYFGLAPGAALSQTNTKSLLKQLLEKGLIDATSFSIMLHDGQHGAFDIGGTSTTKVLRPTMSDDNLNFQNEVEHQEIKRDKLATKQREWKWIKVANDEGWWEVVASGVWVNGAQILRDQHMIFDINTPFLIAPPNAARLFYGSIFGSRRLSPPYDQFHAYPCLGPPQIYLDFDGWKVKVWDGKRDPGTFSPGGRFSLGRMGHGSGYCIGMIVESRFGPSSNRKSNGKGNVNLLLDDEEASGLEDIWIIGEGLFADIQIVFDWKKKTMGMQRL